MTTRNLRSARAEDLGPLIELGRRSWLSAFAQSAPFPLIAWWVREDRTARLYEQHWPEMTVLEEEGGIIGLVHLIHGEINGLWVHPQHQGTGAGSLLLRTGEDILARAGHKNAWLTCSTFNQKALSFYSHRGYVETRRERQVHACGVECGEVRMERLLERG